MPIKRHNARSHSAIPAPTASAPRLPLYQNVIRHWLRLLTIGGCLICTSTLVVAQTTSPVAADGHPAKADQNERLFGVLPNTNTVEHGQMVPPYSAKRAFETTARDAVDPYVVPFVAAVTGLQHRDISYGRAYGTALADNAIGNMLTSAVLPTALHEDPRYYRMEDGSVWHRSAYALSRTLVTRSRDGRAAFNAAELGGNGLAAVIANGYYPAGDRSVTANLTRWASQVMWDAVANEAKEFWPDIRNHLKK